MLGRIDSIENNIVKVKLEVNIYDMDSIINKNIVFKGNNKMILKIIFYMFLSLERLLIINLFLEILISLLLKMIFILLLKKN